MADDVDVPEGDPVPAAYQATDPENAPRVWSAAETPTKQLGVYRDFYRTHAIAGRSFGEMTDNFNRTFPDAADSPSEDTYSAWQKVAGREARMDAARTRVNRRAQAGDLPAGESEGPGAFIAREAVSPIRQPLSDLNYAYAKGQIKNGSTDPDHFEAAARYEREQGLNQDQPGWAKWVGQSLGAAGNIAPTLLTGGANIGVQAYASQAAQEGDGAINPIAAGKAAVPFAAQMLVLRGMGATAAKLFPEAESVLAKAGSHAATGTVGLALADYGTYVAGLTEGGGPIKDALNGRLGDAARATAVNALFTGGMGAVEAIKRGTPREVAIKQAGDAVAEKIQTAAENTRAQDASSPNAAGAAPPGEAQTPAGGPEVPPSEATGAQPAENAAPARPQLPEAIRDQVAANPPPNEVGLDRRQAGRVEIGATNVLRRGQSMDPAEAHALDKFGEGNVLRVDLHSGGEKVGHATIAEEGDSLHVAWMGREGMAGGEGRGIAPFGQREIFGLAGDLARAMPDMKWLKYTPSEGRIRAGEARLIDLDKVRSRLPAADTPIHKEHADALTAAQQEHSPAEVAETLRSARRDVAGNEEGAGPGEPPAAPEASGPAQPPIPPKRPSRADRDRAILEAVRSGRGFPEIAAEHGITRERVRQIANEQAGGDKSALDQVKDAATDDLIDRHQAGEQINGHFDPVSGNWIETKTSMTERGELARTSVAYDPDAVQAKVTARDKAVEDAQRRLDQIGKLIIKASLKKGGINDEQLGRWTREAEKLNQVVVNGGRRPAAKAGEPVGQADEAQAAGRDAAPEQRAAVPPDSAADAGRVAAQPPVDRPAPVQSEGGGVADRIKQLRAMGYTPKAAEARALKELGPRQDTAMGAAALGELTGHASSVEDPNLTGISHAQSAESRQALGLAAEAKRQGYPDELVFQAADALIKSDPDYPTKIIAELEQKNRPTDPVETAVLLTENTRLENAIDRARSVYGADPDGKELIDGLKAQQKRLLDVTDPAGSAAGAAFRLRRALMDEDYSIVGLERRAEKAKGKPLTDAEKGELAELHDKLRKAEAELEELRKTGKQPAAPGQPEEGAVPVKKIKDQITNRINRFEDDSKPWWAKAMDKGLDIERANLLSGGGTIEKLDAAAVARIGLAPIRQAVAGLIGKLPFIRQVAEQSPRWGRVSPKAEIDSITKGLVFGLRAAKDRSPFGEGRSASDIAYGDKPGRQPGVMNRVLNAPGEVHGAIKAVPFENEFARSAQMRTEFYRKRGMATDTAAMQERIGREAYHDAEEATFMRGPGDAITDWFNRLVQQGRARDKDGNYHFLPYLGASALKSRLPIVRVPLNIVGESLRGVFGTITGSVGVADAFGSGIKNLSPDRADLLMKRLTDGTMGAFFLTLGAVGYKQLGGLHVEGDNDKKKALKEGQAQVFGVTIPKEVLHDPRLQLMQIGATAAQQSLRHVKGEPQGLLTGVGAALGSELREVPFVRQMDEAKQLMAPRTEGHAMGEMVKSFAVPQLVQWIARELDKPHPFMPGEEPAKRKQSGFVGSIEAGIPGLRQKLPVSK